MNITTYQTNYDVETLTVYYEWTVLDGIKLNKNINTFFKSYLSNHPISIIHLAGKNNDEIRLNKSFISKVKTLDGDIIDKSLRFKNH